MLTVTHAANQRGWTSRDHLIDDRPMRAMVGKSYSDIEAIKAYADDKAETFPVVYFVDEAGQEWRYDGSPANIPGRRGDYIERAPNP